MPPGPGSRTVCTRTAAGREGCAMTTNAGDLHVLQTVDGSRVRYRRWLPDGDVRGAVQLVHGASEHSGRYSRLAAELTRHGFGVWAMDLRGHGRTAESTGIGRFGGGLGVDTVLEDVEALHLVIDDQHSGVPRVLLGHSMGSIIALASAERAGGTSPASCSPGRSAWPRTSRTRSPLWRRPWPRVRPTTLWTRWALSTRRSSPRVLVTTGCRGTRRLRRRPAER
jgi:alpha-beta hydrolase superfamily lysophospholipase